LGISDVDQQNAPLLNLIIIFTIPSTSFEPGGSSAGRQL